MFYFTKAMSDIFLDAPYPGIQLVTFKDANQILDMWCYMENVLLDGIYWENWYDEAKTPTSTDDRLVLYENHLLGVPRIRQVSSETTVIGVMWTDTTAI